MDTEGPIKFFTDRKFLLALFTTFLAITAIVMAVDKLLGPPLTAIIGATLAAASVEIFRQFEKLSTRTEEISLAWPSFLSISVVAGILVMQTPDILADLFMVLFVHGVEQLSSCHYSLIGMLVLLDWLGFLVCGFVVGRLNPKRGLTVAALGGLIFSLRVVALDLNVVVEGSTRLFEACFDWTPTEAAVAEAPFWVIMGLLARVFLGVLGARWGGRRGRVGEGSAGAS